MITQEYLNKLFMYNPVTGNLYKRKRKVIEFKNLELYRRWHKNIKEPLKRKASNGYLKVSIDGKDYFLHRLIWLMTYDNLVAKIDHRNKNKQDNALINLRDGTNGINEQNTIAKGYTYCSFRGQYRAYLCWGNEWRDLGYYNSEEEAKEARLKAEDEYRSTNK